MLLESVNSPKDLRKLSIEQLPLLASEIRQRMIEVVAQSGGHLASSLGAVELAIALHYCLDTPKDKIVWDVGHQTYAHKILTGRNKDFSCIRKYGGLSGFPSKNESEYDVFTTGHSSTAVSLALGLACSRECLAKEDYFRAIAVIGDGSISGGLCFEGLNNAGHLKKDILVVLNTNELSISPNSGALSIYLNKLISMPVYNRFRQSLETFLKSRVPRGSRLVKLANKFEEGLKGLFIPGMLFEELGFRYFGPLDGHNLNLLIPTLKNILTIKGPLLLHVVTKKGKGYGPAEGDPVRFHSAPAFDIKTGEALKKSDPASPTYTQVFGRKIVELAAENKNIVAITAAMPEGTGLDKFRDLYPQRFFDVGIAEAHAVCFAAGLAKKGLKPVVAIYSTFLQRAYDQIMEAVALQDLGVIFVIDRSGIVGDDGPTHQGVFDIAYLRSIPGVVVMAPKDGAELEAMLEFAVNSDKPVAIRYPKDNVPDAKWPMAKLELGKAEVLKEGKDFTLVALGSMVMVAQEAIDLLEKEGLSGSLINARFAKPLDSRLFEEIAKKTKRIFTVEDGIKDGGLGSAINELLSQQVFRIGVDDEFVPCGKRAMLLDKCGLTGSGIADKIRLAISGKA
ncbi:MAG: 1-deoxy-D-xylulose-5-phosphate synthase [Candidatus Omnitrophota bacterium]